MKYGSTYSGREKRSTDPAGRLRPTKDICGGWGGTRTVPCANLQRVGRRFRAGPVSSCGVGDGQAIAFRCMHGVGSELGRCSRPADAGRGWCRRIGVDGEEGSELEVDKPVRIFLACRHVRGSG